MIMGQRLSELCSKGPYLEEDIAISNIALDYLGQANMLYELLKKAGVISIVLMIMFFTEMKEIILIYY